MWPDFYDTFSYINEQGSNMESVKQLKEEAFSCKYWIRVSFSQKALSKLLAY